MTEGHEDYLGDLWDLLPVDPTDFIEDTPTEDESEQTPSSEWAFDHDADVNRHHTKFTIAEHDLRARHSLAVLDLLVCSEAEAAGLIEDHRLLPAAHHAKYTDANARSSINDIFGADGKADSNIDMDTHTLTGVLICSGLFTLNGDIKTNRWDASAGNTLLGIGVCGADNLLGATYNTAYGGNALFSLVDGTYNFGLGWQAGYAITDGNRNVAIGANSLRFSNGDFNVCIGGFAGYGATGEDYAGAIFIGYKAGYSNKTGGSNIAIGYEALNFNQSGNYSVVIGRQAGRGKINNSFDNSIVIGYRAGYLLETGDNNILIGFQAGNVLTTGSKNIVIGYDIDPSALNATNEINIGGVYKGDQTTTVPKFGTHGASGDVVITGFITIKDLAGNDRKLAVID